MRVRNLISGEEFVAALTTEHAASSYNQPVVIVDGDAIDPVGIEIVDLSAEERAALPPWWQAVIV
ncbi:hypothetical protein CKO23_11245 [Thiocystis violacea]|nr:hypothetical protein [Thiocystis violacea]